MAYEGWLSLGGVEIGNTLRTTLLTETAGLGVIWHSSSAVDWIPVSLNAEAALAADSAQWPLVTSAPWYDAANPASAEFLGFYPLTASGIDDSSLESTATEYAAKDGGVPGPQRHKTKTIVVGGVLVAVSERGADLGLSWLKRVLRSESGGCMGSSLAFISHDPTRTQGTVQPARVLRMNRVKCSRSVSVTRKSFADCAALWSVTFTLTAGDPFVYGYRLSTSPLDNVMFVNGLTSSTFDVTAFGDGFTGVTQTHVGLYEPACAAPSYVPLVDPEYPSFVAPPSVPDPFPANWVPRIGTVFNRFAAEVEPHTITSKGDLVSRLSAFNLGLTGGTTEVPARWMRVSLWPHDYDPSIPACGALASAVFSYVPQGGFDAVVVADGETQTVSYMDVNTGAVINRADSVVFGWDGGPVDWSTFNDPAGFWLTLDLFDPSDMTGRAVGAGLSFQTKDG